DRRTRLSYVSAPSEFEYGSPDVASCCFVCLARAGGVLAEPTHEFLMEHRSDLVDALKVHDSRNDRSDLAAIFLRGRAAFEQTDRICLIDRPLDSCDEGRVICFRHQGVDGRPQCAGDGARPDGSSSRGFGTRVVLTAFVLTGGRGIGIAIAAA